MPGDARIRTQDATDRTDERADDRADDQLSRVPADQLPADRVTGAAGFEGAGRGAAGAAVADDDPHDGLDEADVPEPELELLLPPLEEPLRRPFADPDERPDDDPPEDDPPDVDSAGAGAGT